ERADEAIVFGPIRDGEDHPGKSPAVTPAEGLLEQPRHLFTDIPERAAPPGTQDQRVVPMGQRDAQHLGYAPPHGLANLLPARRVALEYRLRIDRRTSDEGTQVRLLQQRPVVRANHGYVRRVDRVLGIHRVAPGPVGVVHRVAYQAGIKGRTAGE